MTDLLIENLAEIATPIGTTPRRGAEQRAVLRLRAGSGSSAGSAGSAGAAGSTAPDASGVEILCRAGRLAFVGSRSERERLWGELPGTARLDGRRMTAVPGFVDGHTHLPWAGSREDEFVQRLGGRSYQEIAAAGGGILSTVRATRAAEAPELVELALDRLRWMLSCGTTTAEAKSGYGLSLGEELKQLEAIRAAGAAQPVELVPTLLAAHEVPADYRDRRDAYLDLVCEEIVPAAAERGLARFCDVFCEKGVFSAAESRRVLEAGRRHGLLPRLHADEFVDSGGAQLAAELGALSADHLMAVSPAGIEALAAAGVTALLLPGTSFFLAKRIYAPARRLIAAGVPVALGTDCNPGSSYTESLPTIVQLAVFELGMTIEEALTAVTLNPACSLGLGREIGSLEAGKRADIVLLEAPNLLHLAYHYGVNPVRSVIKAGREVYRAGNLAAATSATSRSIQGIQS
ncbi:MAG: imidazolonepropionase [Thermoanaerobaculia bacterium]|nr:imidazolonepropionase [Thermoanaerobaculia bacterium]